MSEKPREKPPELTGEQVKQSLRTGAAVLEILVEIYRSRGVEACTIEMDEHLDTNRAKWAVLAAVIAIVDERQQKEKLQFDQRHFGGNGPALH
jgi:hypothetical protein